MWALASLIGLAFSVQGGVVNPGGGTNIYLWTSNVVYSTGGVYATISSSNDTNEGPYVYVATTNQGVKADTALQPQTSWTNIASLGTAATNPASAFDITGIGVLSVSNYSNNVVVYLGAYIGTNLWTSGSNNLMTAINGQSSTTTVNQVAANLLVVSNLTVTALQINNAGTMAYAASNDYGRVITLNGNNVSVSLGGANLGVQLVAGRYTAAQVPYTAAISMDCSTNVTLDVTNNLGGSCTMTMSNLVAGVPYMATVRTGASGQLFSLAFSPTSKVFAATGSYTSQNIPANSAMIIQAQKLADGSYVFSTTGAQ